MVVNNTNLDMFFETPVHVFNDQHLAALTTQWKKFGPGHSLWHYNSMYHLSQLRNMTDGDVLYRAGLKLHGYSKLAQQVALERGLIK